MGDRTISSTTKHDRTVLAVDDEEALTELYRIWLKDDYIVHTACSGREAIEALDRTIDVVLLDRHMSRISGEEVLTEIRRRDLPCHVAMVTAVDPDFDVIEMGFDEYMIKPVSEDQLRDVVDSLLDRRQYDAPLRNVLSLISKQQVLAAVKPDVDLATQHEYATLVDQITEIQSSLDERIPSFDDEDFRAAFRTSASTQVHQEFQEGDPRNQTERGGSSETRK